MIEPHPTQLFPIILSCAEKHQLNPHLVLAVIETESRGHTWASRYEPGFYRRYLAGKSLKELPGKYPENVDTQEEYQARSSSLGVMQVMGQTARELGYEGSFEDFLNPKINIEFGCRLLARNLKRAKGVVRQALLFYNGGADTRYPERVFKNLELMQKFFPSLEP
jgi:hypothetical protein